MMLGKVWGFTLIELLVVVAIISILASIVLVSLGASRNKGGDAAVKTNLNTIKSQAELFYSNNSDSFLPSVGTVFNINTCPSYDPLGSNMFSKDKVMASVITEAVVRGSGQSSCYNSSIYWAVAISLKTDANTSWCIDSGGNSKQIASVPENAINATTLSCN